MANFPFLHTHPYPPFNLEHATKLIVGTLPPPRFTSGELLERDVDFCYGSAHGMLWPILDRIFGLDLKFENTYAAIKQREDFLIHNHIGICDMVASAERQKIDASDVGMQQVQLRDLVHYLRQHRQVKTLLFTGGNSKNGPEYFFRQNARAHGLKLKIKHDQVPRIHTIDIDGRTVKTVSLTAPSGSANRAIGSMPLYKKLKAQDPSFTTMDFRVMQYAPFFKED
ncbi:MAG: DNA glycosylase [Cytophagaceae bacterium]|nr:DNA glycosylase [Cytophagaceae bacterium]|tara:strand:- start:1444 stop:2118 length:675 start_codon:yes stop_codon:yes gene_type:complete